jgi:hypothetical protein
MATFAEVSEGLAVLARHLEKGAAAEILADHGIVFAPEAKAKALPPLDLETLERLGWHFSTEFNCWAKFT